MDPNSRVPRPAGVLWEVAVDEYKNLSGVRVRWSPHIVLYGQNGMGKTNLLEAVALACGSRATMWQLSKRASEPPPGAISLLVETSRRFLPPPPDRTAPARLFASLTGRVDPFDTMGYLIAERRFWEMLDIERGGTWREALWSGALDARLAELLTEAAERPLIRYTLESLTGLPEARAEDRGSRMLDETWGDLDNIRFQRRFSRVLALRDPPPDWLVAMADTLPDVFAPLRAWLDAPEDARSPHPNLLELPPSDRAPIQVVWMASERSSSEAWFDLDDSFRSALGSSMPVVSLLSELPLWTDADPFSGDDDGYLDMVKNKAAWWLIRLAAEAANSVLRQTAPTLKVLPDEEEPSELWLVMSSQGHEAAHLSDEGFLEQLSSGERVWMDSALAHAAAETERIGDLNRWRSTVLPLLSDDERLDATVRAEEMTTGGLAIDRTDASALDAVALQLDRKLISVEDYIQAPLMPPSHVAGADPDVAIFLSAMTAYDSGVREIREAPTRLTAYDEPERHLHPAAQRQVAASLGDVRSDSVAIATHSHLFLGQPGWKHAYMNKTPQGGLALTEFDTADLDKASEITEAMGLNRGELLAFVSYVLIVEGPVDRLVLESLYGDLLSGAGIQILPLHGIDEVHSLTELTFVGELLDVGIGILADHTRVGHLTSDRLPKDATKEERALFELRHQLKRRGRKIDQFGLKRVDIIAYLDERTVRDRCPDFPGWDQVDRSSKPGNFKQTAERLSGQPFHKGFVGKVARTMATKERPALDDLPHQVSQVVAAAASTVR